MRLAALTCAAVLATAGAASAQAKGVKPIEPGTKAPDFELTTWDGAKTIKLSDFRAEGEKPGTWVVVDFWCSKCPGSRRYEAALSALAREYGGKGVQLIAIDPNGLASREELAEYIAANKIAFPIVTDRKFATADKFGALVTPHLFVVDPQGVVRYTGAIDNRRPADDPRHAPHLKNALDALLAGSQVATPVTRAFG